MKSKKIALLLILISLLPLTMSMIAVFFSGSELKVFPLIGREGITAPLNIHPEMSPLRVIIRIDYGSKSLSTIQRYIKYDVTAQTESGSVLWAEDGRASVSSDNRQISHQSNYSSLQTFDINTPTNIQFNYKIKEANLSYKGGELSVKRNVTRHNLFVTIIGLIMLVIGILVFSLSKQK